MIARAGSGWQTVLADLSLILFMVTAAAVSEAPTQPSPPPPAPVTLPALGEPVAIWRAAPGGPRLTEWLASQPADPRQRLTLVAAPADGPALLAEAAALPRPARVLIEPGLSGPPYAALTYDTGDNL
ncbi:hypothetical protein [Novosphingobium ginsenosidimutans]|uniref:Uncharacterized protein n=1 Tax=Novosphingobium ginsenosidimutans TaxID=1176536 RepID=A0A5B8S217_9SPHN|nr:hypothetical protein [Novosphingobium ginsenosidimutans]QEA15158.1 hypothetical protein FRF71_02840 [Novosphingobium ginsenosidimutans]